MPVFLSNMSHFPSSLSVLPRPTLFWVEEAPGYENGLYLSPNSVVLPQGRQSTPRNNSNYPDPWQYFYPRVLDMSSKTSFWTALCPRKMIFTGFLSPLDHIDLEFVERTGKTWWHLTTAAQAEWAKIERILEYIMRLMRDDWWMKSNKEAFPWPSHYGYAGYFSSRHNAMLQMRKVRAVFMLKVTQVKYMHFLNPIGEFKEASWLQTAYKAEVYDWEVLNGVRKSYICSNEAIVDHVGMIIDVRRGLEYELQRDVVTLLEAFGLPLWLKFGPTPGVLPQYPHEWFTMQRPPRQVVQEKLMAKPSIRGVRTLITRGTSPNVQTPKSSAAARVTYDRTAPRPDPVTRQLPGQSMEEFFKAREFDIARLRAYALPDLLAIWRGYGEQHQELECPRSTTQVRVFEWEEDERGQQIRRLVSHRRWLEVFNASVKTERRYDPVYNEFDICREQDPVAAPEEPSNFDDITLSAEDHMQVDDLRPSKPSIAITLTHASSSSQATSSHPSSSRHLEPSGHHDASRRRRDRQALRATGPIRRQESNPSDTSSRDPSPHPPFEMERSSSSSSFSRHPSDRPSLRTQHHTVSRRRNTPIFTPSPSPEDRHPRELSEPVLDLGSSFHTDLSPMAESSTSSQVQHSPSAASTLWDYSSLNELMYFRYGILEPSQACQVPEELKESYEFLGKKNKLLFLLGHIKETFSPSIFERARLYFSFLVHRVEADQSPPQPPLVLADTAGNPTLFPYRSEHCRLKVVASAGTTSGLTWYQVSPKQGGAMPDVEYIVAVADPLAVNQLIREGYGQSTYQIARILLRKGIAFKTLSPYAGSPQLMFAAPPMPMLHGTVALGLGVRKAGDDNFTLRDYEEYTDRRTEFIWSPSERAALLAGGILRRLAIDALGDQLDEAMVLSGPSPYPTRGNYVVFDGSGYVDDVITDHQADVVCGVYRVLNTGKFKIF